MRRIFKSKEQFLYSVRLSNVLSLMFLFRHIVHNVMQESIRHIFMLVSSILLGLAQEETFDFSG